MVACYTASGMTDRDRQTAKTGEDKSCRNGQMKDWGQTVNRVAGRGQSSHWTQRAESVYWENIRGVLGGNTSSQAHFSCTINCWVRRHTEADRETEKSGKERKGGLIASFT